MKLIRILIGSSLLFACLAWSAGGAEAKKLKVLTSFLPVYCFTANVAGDLADVDNLLPTGVGPHDYQFSPKDLRKIHAADLIVVNGLQLESWLDKAIKSAGRSPVVVEASAGLEGRLITGVFHLEVDGGVESSHGHSHTGSPNPHIWLDPQLAAHAVTNILQALQKADPAHAAGYAENAARYFARLQQLDADLREALAPLQNSSIVTYHDSFPYFARRYGLKIVGVIEEVPEIDPSPRYLVALQRVIRQNKVKAIFTEPQFSPRLARQLGRDLKVPVAPLDTLETGPLTPSAYEDGMRKNLRTLKEYLK